MGSNANRKLLYLRDRAVNAWWMLKEGDFKLIFKSIVREVQCRVEGLKYSFYRFRFLDDNKVKDSAYPNLCKPTHHSCRPTVSRLREAEPALTVDREALLRQVEETVAGQQVREHRSYLWRW